MLDQSAGVPSPSGSCATATKTSHGSAASLVAIERSAVSAFPAATCDHVYEPVLNEITGYMPALQAWVATLSDPVSELTKTRQACRPGPTSLTRWARGSPARTYQASPSVVPRPPAWQPPAWQPPAWLPPR